MIDTILTIAFCIFYVLIYGMFALTMLLIAYDMIQEHKSKSKDKRLEDFWKNNKGEEQ